MKRDRFSDPVHRKVAEMSPLCGPVRFTLRLLNVM